MLCLQYWQPFPTDNERIIYYTFFLTKTHVLGHPLARWSTGTTVTPPDLPTNTGRCPNTYPAECTESWECSHTGIHAQLYPCMHRSVCTHIHTLAHKQHTCAQTYACMHKHTYRNTQAYAHTQVCADMCIYAHTHAQTYMHIYIHTHAHTRAHVHTQAPPQAVLSFTPVSKHKPFTCRQLPAPPSDIPRLLRGKTSPPYTQHRGYHVTLPTLAMVTGPTARPAWARFGVS